MITGKIIATDPLKPLEGSLVKQGANWRLRRYEGFYDREWVLFVDRLGGFTIMTDFDHCPTDDEIQIAIMVSRLEGE